ncbi:hypothetical protein ACSSS7_000230 [Eimeria intestinalis]
MVAAQEEGVVEGPGSAFSRLVALALSAFLDHHTSLSSFDYDSSSSSSSSSSDAGVFTLPQDLLLQLQKEGRIALDEPTTGSSSSSSSSCRGVQNDFNEDLYRCFLILSRVYRQLHLISSNETADEISTPLLK